MKADLKLLEALRERLLIDEDDLDRELIEQPSLFEKVGKQFVLAVSHRDELKGELKAFEAKLSLQYRKELEDQGKKSTEAVIAALVETDQDRLVLHKKLLEIQALMGEWENLKDSFYQRDSALTNLCKLYVAGYFSKSSIKGPAAASVIEQEDRTRRSLINEERRKRLD